MWVAVLIAAILTIPLWVGGLLWGLTGLVLWLARGGEPLDDY